MEWNAKQYDQQHNFVTKYGENLLTYLPTTPCTILDIGCGTGALTNTMAQQGHQMLGIDASATMIQQAKQLFPELNFKQTDILTFQSQKSFDILFSNAVFHWIPQQTELLERCHQLLINHGKLLCEFGAKGNIQQIEQAFIEELHTNHFEYHSPFFFPSTDEYQQLLETAGFEILHLIDYDRPTVLKGEQAGLRNWMKQFFATHLEKIPLTMQEQIFQNIEEKLAATLWKTDHWEADYRRIQVFVEKI